MARHGTLAGACSVGGWEAEHEGCEEAIDRVTPTSPLRRLRFWARGGYLQGSRGMAASPL